MSAEWITTSTMLSRLRDFEDDAAWQQLVERFRRPIASFAIDLGVHPDRADDVAQDTLLDFARAYREGKYDRDRGRLSKWLFGFAYRRALKARSRQGREPHHLPIEEAVQVPDERWATTMWERRWTAQLFAECVERARLEFSPETFRAFELVVGFERRPTEAALELGVPVKRIYNAKHRVLKRIRELTIALEDA